MRFLLDENVSYRVASHLKAAGHDAVHVSKIGLTSADDSMILARARAGDQVLISGATPLAELHRSGNEPEPAKFRPPGRFWMVR
jgi:predicted nuclease of predicted toxin-antitoxin system